MKLLEQLLSTVLLLLISVELVSAQNETVPVSLRNNYGESEEYNVLKTDKTIRQGAYAKYRVVAGPRNEISMQETGNYKQGRKEGEWRTFFDTHLLNRLSSKGNYHAGVPQGQWIYYHRPGPGAPSKVVYAGKNPKQSLVIDLDDTLAVVRAKGVLAGGSKVGLWKYYDERATLVQAVNESTNQLVYWLAPDGRPVSGEGLAANHPLLYAGGRNELLFELRAALNLRTLLSTGALVMKAGQSSTTELIIAVDSAGRQTGVALAANVASTRYEQFLLAEVSRLNTQRRWLPQVTNGKAVASAYHVLIVADKPSDNGVKMAVKPLGD